VARNHRFSRESAHVSVPANLAFFESAERTVLEARAPGKTYVLVWQAVFLLGSDARAGRP
jgi:hypothetical protein